jgi:phage terminase large subunit-like protein
VVAHEDKNSNYKPNKERKSSKIDGAVASIMGISRALTMKGMTIAEAIDQGYGVRTL